MTITEEIFQSCCTAAASPIGYGILPLIGQQIRVAKGGLVGLLGTALFDSIPDSLNYEYFDPSDKDQMLAVGAYNYVCLAAFYNAIPHLDLTLSQAGFGVVSNQNVAPASADRVERLRRQVRNASETAYDSILDTLRGNPAWCETAVAKRVFSTLVWCGRQMLYFGYADPHHQDLYANQSKISMAEIKLQNLIGSDCFQDLCDSQRRDTTTDVQAKAIDFSIKFLAAEVSGVKRDIDSAKLALLAYLDENISNFESYKNSTAYEANHFEPYKNEKNDPCYFFG